MKTLQLSITIFTIVGLAASISLASVYMIYFKDDVSNNLRSTDAATRQITNLSTEISPQTVTVGLADLSLKGYLKTAGSIGISDEKINVILEKIQTNGNQTIKNLYLGNSTTDQNGCFYFNSWNSDMLNKTLGKIPGTSGTNNVLTFKTNFGGANEFLSSSNSTEVRYSTFIPSIMRPAINAFLYNGTGFLSQDLDLKRGKSYDFGLYVTGGMSENMVKLNVKGFPCGVNGILENDTIYLTAQNDTTHLKISVNEKAKQGRYYYTIVGNNWILKEGELIIE
ncbi:MAG TPA: hypothetical protein VFX64_05820 [Candidatus Nitrosotalea sp.]|nr:hypothetical protein [Candidatus Nitrosotalea sp.]